MRQPLQKARARSKALDGRANRAGPVQEREQLRRRPGTAENLQTLFAAAHAHQPVVDQHEARVVLPIHARECTGKWGSTTSWFSRGSQNRAPNTRFGERRLNRAA